MSTASRFAARLGDLPVALKLGLLAVGLALIVLCGRPDAVAARRTADVRGSHRHSLAKRSSASRGGCASAARRRARAAAHRGRHHKIVKRCAVKKPKAAATGWSATWNESDSSLSPGPASSGTKDPKTGAALSAKTPEPQALEDGDSSSAGSTENSGSAPSEPVQPPSEPGEPARAEEPAPAEEPTPGAELSIAVSGNHLVNSKGKVVTLHGVNISGTEWQCLYGKAFYGPHSEESIAAIAAWHINAVRIPLNEDCWLGINGAPTDIGVFHEEIRDYVEQLHAHGMYAILDLHWSAPEGILSHLGPEFAGFYEMADESHSPAFWASVASYFKNDHAVLFDLFNDPSNISWDCWLNGCIAPRGYQTAGMQQLVDSVRETGATQPVLVTGLENADLSKAWLEHRPTDPAGQLVASAHIYNQKSTSHFNANIGIVAEQFPVVATELGEMDCADEDIDAFLPWADAHGVSYLAWAWFVGGCSDYPSLISNYNGTPTSFGVGYREHLLASFPSP